MVKACSRTPGTLTMNIWILRSKVQISISKTLHFDIENQDPDDESQDFVIDLQESLAHRTPLIVSELGTLPVKDCIWTANHTHAHAITYIYMNIYVYIYKYVYMPVARQMHTKQTHTAHQALNLMMRKSCSRGGILPSFA